MRPFKFLSLAMLAAVLVIGLGMPTALYYIARKVACSQHFRAQQPHSGSGSRPGGAGHGQSRPGLGDSPGFEPAYPNQHYYRPDHESGFGVLGRERSYSSERYRLRFDGPSSFGNRIDRPCDADEPPCNSTGRRDTFRSDGAIFAQRSGRRRLPGLVRTGHNGPSDSCCCRRRERHTPGNRSPDLRSNDAFEPY